MGECFICHLVECCGAHQQVSLFQMKYKLSMTRELFNQANGINKLSK